MHRYVRLLLPDDTPKPLYKYIRLTNYVDANLFHNQLNGSYVMGILYFTNKIPLDWYSNKWNTVETDAYGYAFVSTSTYAEQIIDFQNTL